MASLFKRIQDKVRSSSVAKSVVWSIGSKFGGAILQFGALPVAIHVLGKELFGVYAVIATVLTLLGTLNLGIGPSMSKELSYAIEHKDLNLKSRVYTTAVIQSGVFLIGVFVLLFGAGLVIPMRTLFNTDPAYETLAREAYLTAITMGSLAIVFSTIETAQLAELEIYKANRAACASIFLSASATILLFKYLHVAATPALLVILIYGLPLLPRLVNCTFFLRTYDVAKMRLSYFDSAYFSRSLKSNTKFTIMQLASFLFDGFGIIWIGRLYGSGEVGKVSIIVNLCVGVFGSIVMMILLPTWPIISRTYAAANVPEYIKTLKRLYLAIGTYSVLLFVIFMLFGSMFLGRIYGKSLVPEFPLLLSVMAYYFLNRFDTVGFNVLVASDGDDIALFGQTLKTIMGLGIAFVLSKFMGESFFYTGLFIGTLMTTSWYYVYAIRNSVRKRMESASEKSLPSGSDLIGEIEIQEQSVPFSEIG